MIFFTLPNFFENFHINNFFIRLNKEHQNYFKTDINFIQTSGSFPYCSWCGGYNSNQGNGAFYNDFINCFSINQVPLRINFANIFLQETDFYDTMSNLILETNHNGSNLIEISNLQLMEKIKNQYPYYKFIFSKQAHLMTPFTPELLNEIIDLDKFSLIGLPDIYLNDKKFLSEIQKKSKIEITVNPKCPLDCSCYTQCQLQEHQSQIIYSESSNIKKCKKTIMYSKYLSLEDIKNQFLTQGFTHFTFSSEVKPEQETFLFYLHYFIKKEYQEEVLANWLKEKIKHVN